MNFKKLKLHCFSFQVGDVEALNNLIFQTTANPKESPLLLAHYNLHGLYLGLRNKDFKKYLTRCRFSWIDGFGILLLLKLTGEKIDRRLRVTFLDWQHSFFKIANQKQLSVFLLGGSEENIITALKNLSLAYPNIRFNYHNGFFDTRDFSIDSPQTGLINNINAASVDILLVGMGMPRQEIWIDQNAHQLDASVIMPIGGYFDYIAGETKTPNRFLSGLGLEWLIRLVNEPRRLAYRYLIEPWYILYRLTIYYFWKK